MNEPHLLIWFLATATVTTTVLTVGTLAAAGMLPRRKRARVIDAERGEHPS